MKRTEVYVKRLTNQQRAALADALRGIEYPESSYGAYLSRIRRGAEKVADVFSDVLQFRDFSRSAAGYGALKIENLPVDENPPMPPVENSQIKRIAKDSYVSENVLTLIASFFGMPYSMECEGRGLVNNLIPSQSTAAALTGLGASSDLRLHIENSALRVLTRRDCSPKALFLTGVRQDVQPPLTRLSDARCALDRLSCDDLRHLQSPAYRLRLPYRWRGFRPSYDEVLTPPIPLLEFAADGLLVYAAFYGDMIGDVLSPAAERAAKRFEAALEESAIDEIVAPGEILGFDNRVTLHARTPFPATFDERGRARRWVQRMFVTEHMVNFSDWQWSDDRVFAPRFAARELRVAS